MPHMFHLYLIYHETLLQENQIVYPHGMNLVQEVRTAYIDELKSEILELPYQGGNLAMIIVLPKSDYNIDVVDGLIRRFDTSSFEKRLDADSPFTDVEVTLPRFGCEFDWSSLSETMRQLNVKSLFDEEKANLTNISDQPLYVTQVNNANLIRKELQCN